MLSSLKDSYMEDFKTTKKPAIAIVTCEALLLISCNMLKLIVGLKYGIQN